MNVIEKLSSSLGRKDNLPNQGLAKSIAEGQDKNDIAELVHNLGNKNRAIQSDCIKVLYEIGYINPKLIAPYVLKFCDLLRSGNNRLVWGSMIALSTIAVIEPHKIYDRIEDVIKAMKTGSVITVDNGVSVLAHVASARRTYEKKIFPFLMNHLRNCRPKEIAQHAERTVPALNKANVGEFRKIITDRLDDLSEAQKKRVKRIIKNEV